jgi:hypothetical protein
MKMGQKPKTFSFQSWMAAADAEVSKKFGLSIYDLPDIDYASMYEDGYSPAKAAARAIKSAKSEMGY